MADKAKTKTDPKLVKHTYVFQVQTWWGPHLKEEGDEIDLTQDEAKYYEPHTLKKKKTDAKPASAKPAKA
ncbi:hypothetical protein SAMN04488527_101255 [Aliiroseovarius crassostreae]|uniref:Uncharacterized protein n=1 Tax=Aliiroseovarius crassostreae TaxID=154981 RepID=A0A0P7I4L8_9RHOB|nr:hypothetical protein [Aliiroseovarius crassostreae]KPN64254.1 hypothetical protein AKJ29_16600 [Aliiroseovarius crassostreae]SFU31026.1 hypothetical protein SAMN04488527_101255 [Aliiroseovarius crassostreae]